MTWATPELQSHLNVVHTKTQSPPWQSFRVSGFLSCAIHERDVIFCGSDPVSVMISGSDGFHGARNTFLLWNSSMLTALAKAEREGYNVHCGDVRGSAFFHSSSSSSSSSSLSSIP